MDNAVIRLDCVHVETFFYFLLKRQRFLKNRESAVKSSFAHFISTEREWLELFRMENDGFSIERYLEFAARVKKIIAAKI